MGRELDESVFKYYYLGYGPFRLNFDTPFFNKQKATDSNSSSSSEQNFSKFDSKYDLFADDPDYDDVGFMGLEFVRGNGVNLSYSTTPFTLKDILKDFVNILYSGFKEITKKEAPDVTLNFIAENKSSIVLSIVHLCIKLFDLSEIDKYYYKSFNEFDTSYCDAFNENEVDPVKFKWLSTVWNKSISINPFIGSASWQNHNLILLLNGIFDEEKLFPLSQQLLQSQILLTTPHEKFFKIEEEYFDFITERTGIKYTTDHSGGEYNQFFDNYIQKDFYNLINKNFEFRKNFSISKQLVSSRSPDIRFFLDNDIRNFNIDNYYLAGLLDNFSIYISDATFKSCLHYLSNRFERFKDVFKVSFKFISMLSDSDDFVPLNPPKFKEIVDDLIKDN